MPIYLLTYLHIYIYAHAHTVLPWGLEFRVPIWIGALQFVTRNGVMLVRENNAHSGPIAFGRAVPHLQRPSRQKDGMKLQPFGIL